MPWKCDPLPKARAWLLALALAFVGGWSTSDDAQAKEAFLVTYGVGEEVWEWFGHNALWLRDPAQELDHGFSFGYFDIEASGFYWRFAKGDMRYFGSSVAVDREFGFYRSANRSIRVQRLNLTPAQFDQLHRSLTEAIYPYPRYYDYDYYWANCSTWLRDLLDQALGGAVAQELKSRQASASFRAHTARLTAHQPLAQWGLMTILGQGADQPLSQWDELFLPEVMADTLAGLSIHGQAPLVLEDRYLFLPSDALMSASQYPSQAWLGGLGLLFGLLVTLPLWFSRLQLGWTDQVAIVLVSLVGMIIAWLWFFSGHEIAQSNHLIAVANPMLIGLLPVWPRRLQQLTWWLCLLGLLAGLSFWLIDASTRQSGWMLAFFLPVSLGILAMSAKRVVLARATQPKQTTEPLR